MSEVDFKNTRFDPETQPFEALAKEVATAYGYTADLKVDPQLTQLLRLRVAQENKCAYCSILHNEAARKREILQAKIDNLPAYWMSELYTDAEKAALEYCDALGRNDTAGFPAIHARMMEHFSLEEIAEIAAIISNMHLWTRWKLAHGQTPVVK